MASAWSVNASAAGQSPRSMAAMPRSARTRRRTARRPRCMATSTAWARIGSARSGSPSSRWETPSVWSMVARYGLAGLSPSKAVWASRRISRDTAAAQQGPQVGQLAAIVSPSGSVAGGRIPFGGGRPTFRLARPAEQGEDQRTVDGDGRVVLDPRPVLQPLHPAQHRVDPATGPHRLHQVQDQPGDLLRVARGLGVFDGRLRHGVRLVPLRRPGVQPGNDVRLASAELGVQQLSEQLVVAVPLAAAVERDHQEVAALQLLREPGSIPSSRGSRRRAPRTCGRGSRCG